MENTDNIMDSPKDAAEGEIKKDNEHENELRNEKKKTGIRINEETVRIITNVAITVFSTAALLGSIALGSRGKRRS